MKPSSGVIPKLGGIVLCGGQSRRMGQSKSLLPFGEVTMLQRVVAILQEVVSPVVVVAARDQNLPELPDDVLVTVDEFEAKGPLVGLAAGLAALNHTADAAYLSACDAPLLRPEFVRFMHQKLGENAVAIPKADGHFHPLAAIYRTSVEQTVRQLIQENRMRPFFLVEECESVVLDGMALREADPDLDSLRNANTPDEYKELLEYLNRDVLSHPMAPAFCHSFANGDVPTAERLLDRFSELRLASNFKAHPLLSECVARNDGHCHKPAHLQIADLLTPQPVRDFRAAVLDNNASKVRTLLKQEPNLIDSQFTAGRGIAQAIHHWSSIDVAKVLIETGANIEATTTRGETALAMQLRFGTIDTVRWLLEQGADPNNTSPMIPSDHLAETIELLLEHGWNLSSAPMLHDANHGHGQRVITWLKYGADPNARNESGQTALHIFATKGIGREAIQALATAGADLTAKDNDGHTPLDLAKLAKRKTAATTLESLDAV